MKAKACLRKVRGLEQHVAVSSCTVGCLLLQLSHKWVKKKGRKAVFGCFLSLVAEGLAN